MYGTLLVLFVLDSVLTVMLALVWLFSRAMSNVRRRGGISTKVANCGPGNVAEPERQIDSECKSKKPSTLILRSFPSKWTKKRAVVVENIVEDLKASKRERGAETSR